jgi:transcriptional/translational regulatory protein YebC/TACO1
VPNSKVEIVDADKSQKIFNLLEAIDDLDDVQDAWTNADMTAGE